MSLLPRGRRTRRLMPLGVLVASAAAVAPVAFAADPAPDPMRTRCAGIMASAKGDFAKVAYTLSCRGDIKSYAVVTNDSDYGTEGAPDIYTGTTNQFADSTTNKLSCEADIPSYGLICAGAVVGKNTIVSTFEPVAAPCSPKGYWLPRASVVVTAPDGTQSGPFRLSFQRRCKPEHPAKKQ